MTEKGREKKGEGEKGGTHEREQTLPVDEIRDCYCIKLR